MLICLLFAAMIATSTTQPVGNQLAFTKTADGIKVKEKSGVLWLEATSADTIRVRFSADGVFRPQRVPVVVGNPGYPAIRVSQSGKSIVLTTQSIKAIVDRRKLAVSFQTADGKPIISEAVGGRTLAQTILDGPRPVKSFRSGQRFTISLDEGIYGLGQHQDGLMNYRGNVVRLEQQNREIAIPFVVSSRGYGLLWNNPSFTTVGAAASESQLNSGQLADDDRRAGGLTGQYFRGQNFQTPVNTRRDRMIDFDWSKTPPPGLPHNNYSVRWTGMLLAPATGEYRFKTISDDGVRLWVDGKQIIDNWTVHPAVANSVAVNLKANTSHRIRIEYFQAGGDAIMRFSCAIVKPSHDLTFASDAADGIDYTLFYGPKIDKVLSEYRHATGEAPLIPKWALGYWQSKERYATERQWIDIAAEYRNRNHPIDNLVQDWFYWDPAPWGSHKFDPGRYPDPAAGIKALHEEYNLHFMISVWGKFNPGTPLNPDENFDKMQAAGFLYPASVSSDRYYDAFNPAARELYWQLMRDEIFKFGVDAWWLDASEPEVDMNAFRKTETAAGLGAQVLNGWPLMHTSGVSSGQLRDAPNKRPFILTRSAFAGQQRTGAACWSGDITANWDVLAAQIPAGLNFGLSGIPYWTTDIGAFFVPHDQFPGGAGDPKYRELFTRWFQYGSFCPIFRVHGTDFAKEMWRFGPETEAILNRFDDLRYRLMPYIYSNAWQVTCNGGTLMRALVMDFPEDVQARNCADEFMFGPSLLVCPVIHPGVKSRSVYLPKGSSWTDFWKGETYPGGESIQADAPIDKMPLFIRSGAILPMGPVIQYVDQIPADPIELRVCPGANGSFTMYEDQGSNNDYKHGAHATIPMTWDNRTGTLSIGKRKGSYPGMLKTRTFKVTLTLLNTAGVGPSKDTMAIKYDGNPVKIKVLRTIQM